MTAIGWTLFGVGVAAIAAYALWWYRSREDPVPGRGTAACLRVGALSLAWLLLLNPTVPAALRGERERRAILLDASLSMSRPLGTEGGRLWDAAVDSAAGAPRVWLFGREVPIAARADSLPGEPTYRASLLAPALRAAAAAGADQVTIVSDGEIADSAVAAEEIRRQALDVSFVGLAPAYPQAGIARVVASPWVVARDTARARIEVVATAGGEGDSLTVEIRDEEERALAAVRIPRPASGRFTEARVSFQVTGSTRHQRLVARLVSDRADLEQRDDVRPFYVHVSERPLGPVLISLRPDWEPTFLLPNLDRLTDVPAAAFVLLADADSLLALDDYRRFERGEVERRGRETPLLVVHGYSASAPAWVRQLVRSAERLLILPAEERAFALPGWGVRVGPAAGGEWYLSSAIPPSPVALSFDTAGTEGLPPLVRLRDVDGGTAAGVLAAQRLRRGEARPVLLIGRSETRRWAVAAAEGYWRWAFQSAAGRRLYRALWTGVGGWLLEDGAGRLSDLPPVSRVVERGEPLMWVVPTALDSMTLALTQGDSAIWRGGAAGGDSLSVFLPPGRYEYSAQAYRSDQAAVAATGPVEVEEFASELLPRPHLRVAGSFAGDRPASVREGRRLASLGWPFLVLIALFCAEWAVRRTSGLS